MSAEKSERLMWLRTIALRAAPLLAASFVGGLVAVGGTQVIEKEDWERPDSAEGGIHDAVASMARNGLLAEGDRFRVVEIQGLVGEHNSPWHITYSATIETVEDTE